VELVEYQGAVVLVDQVVQMELLELLVRQVEELLEHMVAEVVLVQIMEVHMVQAVLEHKVLSELFIPVQQDHSHQQTQEIYKNGIP
jgi:hypothetical protein